MLQVPSTDIAFCFTVYKEFSLATRLINQIRSYYPESDVICIMDGTCNIEFIHLCEQEQVVCIEGKRLYVRHLGGAWVERLLKTYLERSNADYMIKLDPDSYLRRKFSGFPDTDLGGSLSKLNHLSFTLIQGGCRFQTRETCDKILASNLLKDSQYREKNLFSRSRSQAHYFKLGEQFEDIKHPGEDAIISHVVSTLNLSISDWAEVHCRDVDNYCQDADRYAVIHPVRR